MSKKYAHQVNGEFLSNGGVEVPAQQLLYQSFSSEFKHSMYTFSFLFFLGGGAGAGGNSDNFIRSKISAHSIHNRVSVWRSLDASFRDPIVVGSSLITSKCCTVDLLPSHLPFVKEASQLNFTVQLSPSPQKYK